MLFWTVTQYPRRLLITGHVVYLEDEINHQEGSADEQLCAMFLRSCKKSLYLIFGSFFLMQGMLQNKLWGCSATPWPPLEPLSEQIISPTSFCTTFLRSALSVLYLMPTTFCVNNAHLAVRNRQDLKAGRRVRASWAVTEGLVVEAQTLLVWADAQGFHQLGHVSFPLLSSWWCGLGQYRAASEL